MAKNIKKRIAIIAASVVLFVIIALSAAIIWYRANLSAVAGADCGGSCEAVQFIVSQDTSATAIAKNLEEKGLIKSALAFRIYLSLEAENKNLLPGEYSFMKNMDVEAIVKSLNQGVPVKTFRITFYPGETIRAAKQRIIKLGYSESEVDAAFSKKYDHELLRTKPNDASLEGYIWGETYEFYATATVEEILTRTFDEMLKVVKEDDLINKYGTQGFTLHEGITLASIIQREAPNDYEEKRHVAQVFLKRLSNNISLGSDAIIAYAADQINPNRDKTDMSYLNTVQCPWNSRRCKGLPPTPIAVPNRDSLKAAADPTNDNDYYFITGDDGKMYYAETEAGHNENIKNYCKELCKLL